MVSRIAPLVRLNCKKSITLARAINYPIIIIPIYDFISNSTTNLKKKFEEITRCGGIHKFLNYNGIVILSLIMRDELLRKFNSPERYAEIINCLNPDFYFTPDGSTYEKKEKESLREVINLCSLTQKLINLCPNSKPIGLVKGSNSIQIINHKNFLKELGIKIFVFHTGDFFRNGDEGMIQRAKHYCFLIKEKGNFLMLYGFGSPRKMLEFSFSDMFITYTHFVNAKHKKIFIEKRKRKISKISVYEAALYNFGQLLNYLKDIKYQTKLYDGGRCLWVEELAKPELLMTK